MSQTAPLPAASIAGPRPSADHGSAVAAAADERPLRADAKRNRERILSAAREVFGAAGVDGQMETIAREAGVGIGTLYRNFPTKQDLYVAIARDWVANQVRDAEAALTKADPVAAYESFIINWAHNMAQFAGLRQVMAQLSVEHYCPAEEAKLDERLGILLERAAQSGRVRTDVKADDLRAMLCGLSATIASGGDWQRCAEFMLAGLRR